MYKMAKITKTRHLEHKVWKKPKYNSLKNIYHVFDISDYIFRHTICPITCVQLTLIWVGFLGVHFEVGGS